MKYIKINTPLQVVGGFSVNESVIIVDDKITPFDGLNEIELYKDYDAYNKNHKPIQLINPLPQFELIYKGINNIEVELTLNDILSTLKANEYDAEIVTTSRLVNELNDNRVEVEKGTFSGANGKKTVVAKCDAEIEEIEDTNILDKWYVTNLRWYLQDELKSDYTYSSNSDYSITTFTYKGTFKQHTFEVNFLRLDALNINYNYQLSIEEREKIHSHIHGTVYKVIDGFRANYEEALAYYRLSYNITKCHN